MIKYALAQNTFDSIREGFLNPHGSYFFLYVGFAIVIIIAISVFITYFILRAAKNKEHFEFEIEKFYDECHERNLSAGEIGVLKEMWGKFNLKNPLILVNNKSKFLQYSDKLLSGYEKNYGNKARETVAVKSMIKHIMLLYDFKKAGKGEIVKTSKDLRKGQNITVFHKAIKKSKPITGTIVYLDDFFFACFFHNVTDNLLEIEKGTKIDLTFNREGDANYFFTTKVLKVTERQVKGGGIGHILALSHSGKLYRTQKRRFPRLRVNTQIMLRANNQKIHPEASHIDCTMVDISEGGICLETKTNLEKDLLVRLSFILVIDYEEVLAQIVAVQDKKNRYIIHLKFIDMDFELRGNIRKYIMTRSASKEIF
jgi:c-di-GMP-binding flagellar brake protein YcgR